MLSNLPDGVTPRMIEEQAGALDQPSDTEIPFCQMGEAYCMRTDKHAHCEECGATTHPSGECDSAWRGQIMLDSTDRVL